MSVEHPYQPLALPGARAGAPALAQPDWPAPDLRFARPMGAWVIVGALFVVVVALWTMIAVFFSAHA
ncbi:MAG: hypothetical protein KGR99_04190 [Betaproteobacteria bacterium]|nr:hypothetical protein [Betaproteobacteria bacterium]